MAGVSELGKYRKVIKNCEFTSVESLSLSLEWRISGNTKLYRADLWEVLKYLELLSGVDFSARLRGYKGDFLLGIFVFLIEICSIFFLKFICDDYDTLGSDQRLYVNKFMFLLKFINVSFVDC